MTFTINEIKRELNMDIDSNNLDLNNIKKNIKKI